MQKHKCLSEQMASPLNFKACDLVFFPQLSLKLFFTTTRTFEANWITKYFSATLPSFLMLSVLHREIHPQGICIFPKARRFQPN
jgi:hypothetical protein